MSHSIRTLPTSTLMPHQKITESAITFSGSRHKGNRAQAYVALCNTIEEANDRMEEHGISWQARKRVLYNFGHLVNQPDMEGEDFHLFTNEPLYESIPAIPSSLDGYTQEEFIKILDDLVNKIRGN